MQDFSKLPSKTVTEVLMLEVIYNLFLENVDPRFL